MLSQPIYELQFIYLQHSPEMPKQNYKLGKGGGGV
jgi:hypothetical protein